MNSVLYKVATGTKCHKLFINDNGKLCLTVYKDPLSSDGQAVPAEDRPLHDSTGLQVYRTFYMKILSPDNCR
jgi:hypothetical protein